MTADPGALVGWAWVFPGQGGQFPGMARGLFRDHPAAADVADEAESLARLPLRELARSGPAEALRRPDVLEPLLAATAIAYVDALAGAGHRPAAVAGYSAGEVGALYAAGVLTRPAALRAAVWRGELLREAALATPGGVAAVLGLGPDDLAGALRAEGEGVALAADNAPRHAAVAGRAAPLGRLIGRLGRLGGEAHPVDVAGPWHGPWLRPLADELDRRLMALAFAPPALPILPCATGAIEDDPARLRRGLADQLAGPVLWRAAFAGLRRLGCRDVLEVGSGGVLRDLARRNLAPGEGGRVEGLEGRQGGDAPLRRWLAAPAGSRP